MADTGRPIKRIAISTGGGDAPGLNAVIRAVTLAAPSGWEVVGIRDGFNGLMFPEQYRDGGVIALTPDACAASPTSVAPSWAAPTAAIHRLPGPAARRELVEVDRTGDLVRLFREPDIDALITIGGDGSLAIGHRLSQAGLRVIGVPKTIDNDLDKTATFGFDTAVELRDRSASTGCSPRPPRTAACS